MDMENKPLDPEQAQETPEDPEKKKDDAGQKDPPHENIVTRFYDRLNVSVRTLDIAIVVLCALILFLLVFGNKIHLGF